MVLVDSLGDGLKALKEIASLLNECWGASSKMLEIRIVKEVIMWKNCFSYPLLSRKKPPCILMLFWHITLELG